MKKKLLTTLAILTSLTSIGAISYVSEQLNKFTNLKEITNIESENHYSYKEIVSRLKDPKLLAYAVEGEESEQYSSYDRYSTYNGEKYFEWDANGDRDGVLARTPDGGYVIAEMNGPGYVSRIWSAMGYEGKVKIYVDDKDNPIISCNLNDIFRGNGHPIFAFGNLSYDASQGDNTYVPITYNEYCKIVVYNPGGYYLVNYTELPEGSTVESMGSTLTSEQKEALDEVNDFFETGLGTNPSGKEDAEVETGIVTKTSSYSKTLSGRGAIEGMTFKINIDAPKTSDTMVRILKLLQLRIYWNGETTPSVDVPLGDFVGSGYGLTDIRTVVAGVRDDKTIYSYYYMPYLDGARIEIVNLDDTEIPVEVSITTGELDEKASTYKFCALWNRGHYIEDESRMPDYNFVNIEGEGKILGVNLHHYKWLEGIDPTSGPGPAWWGEGDEKFYVDGEDFPSWYGTGTEDFFGYAWCDGNKFSRAFHAQSYCVGGSNNIGNRCLTRIFMGEALPFDESFNGYIEKYYKDNYIKYAFTTTFYLSLDGTFEKPTYEVDNYLDYFKLDPKSMINNLIEAEDFEYTECDGEIVEQKVQQTDAIRLSNGKNIWWNNTEGIGSKITVWSPAGDTRGEYVLLASTLQAPDFGQFKVSVNGNVINNNVDFYGESLNIDSFIELGKTTLESGYQNKITFECIGKNEVSTNYHLGLDFILAVPTSEYTTLSEFNLLQYTDVVRSSANPNNEIVLKYEAENYTPGFTGVSNWMKQSMIDFGSGWSMDEQLFWFGANNNDEMYFKFNSSMGGKFNFSASFTTASDYAIVEVYINGVSVGQVDLYSETIRRINHSFGECNLLQGENTISFRVIGKNNLSTGNVVGVDCILFNLIDSNTSIINYEVENRSFVFDGKNSYMNQNMLNFGTQWSGNGQFLWYDVQLGNSVSFTINSESDIKANLVVGVTIAKDMGIYEIYINGNKIGNSIDLYNGSVAKSYRSLGECNLLQGENTITLKVIDKNALANGYNLGLDNLLFYI